MVWDLCPCLPISHLRPRGPCLTGRCTLALPYRACCHRPLHTKCLRSHCYCFRFSFYSFHLPVSSPLRLYATPAMELVPSLVGTSDGSSCNDSTGLLTPESSPLFRPSYPKDSFETRLSNAFDEPKRRRLHAPSTRAESPFVPSFADLFAPVPSDVRKICVIGAGYVGTFSHSGPSAPA